MEDIKMIDLKETFDYMYNKIEKLKKENLELKKRLDYIKTIADGLIPKELLQIKTIGK